MITRKDAQTGFSIEGMNGGDGTVGIDTLSCVLPERIRFFSGLNLAPGTSIGGHLHEGESEIFYVLEGQALITDDDETYEAFPGDCIVTLSGHRHAVENNGNVPLRVLAIVAVE